ncbi:dynactin-associated protein-like [Bos javanicus]|uniref:dynactin-associated protein-like n=1 Tax=Bos javanicus TaxID=9906 RepID=UPI002AA81975|nr:dynactin-associated protein-like [Bos javanicus]
MDRKRGKYVVNIEDSGNQPPLPNLTNYEAHSSACGLTTSIDVTGDAGPSLTDVCTNTATLGYSEFPNRVSPYCQMTRNFFSDWSLWKIFLTSLLASVITTAIGVLIVSLVYNGKNNNPQIVIQIPQNQGTVSTTTDSTSSTSSDTTVGTSTVDSATTSTSTTTAQ